MKQLEITTNKRLLIVEYPDDRTFKESLFFFTTFKTGAFEQYFVKLICKGSDLSEDIAKGFTHSMNFGTDENPDIGYHHSIKDNYWCGSALESFVSAIEAYGYHWGENPLGEEPQDIPDLGEFTVMMRKKWKQWQESESRTFKIDKCIIFEML